MESMILETTLRELSDGDRAFLDAMAKDKTVSRLADIATRMGVTPNYANQYRTRLLDHGLIGTRGRGKLGFDMPMLRDLLQDAQRDQD
jgi:hypothetical protein